MDHFVSGSELYNPLFQPYAHMWYPIALFLWRYTGPEFEKLRHGWVWALGLALFSSAFWPGKNWTLLANCLTFFPFFLLGLETEEGKLQQIRRLPHWLCAGILGLTFAAAVVLLHWFDVDVTSLSFLSRYFSPTLAGLPHLGVMVLRYVLAAVMSVCMLNLIPAGAGRLTNLGRNTMTILLFHNLPGLRNVLYWLEPCKDSLIISLVWWIFWSGLFTLVLGSQPVARLYSRLMDALIRRIPRKNSEKYPPVQ
jgi:fucose 4-O-acetylase-like acetyltransferase